MVFFVSKVLRLRGLIPRETKWDVVVDLFFYRDPEEAEKEEQAAKEQVAAIKPVEVAPVSIVFDIIYAISFVLSNAVRVISRFLQFRLWTKSNTKFTINFPYSWKICKLFCNNQSPIFDLVTN